MVSGGMSIGRITSGFMRRAGARQASAAMRLRGGMGLPVKPNPPPDRPLHEQDEMVWDDGNFVPEPCIDIVAPHISKTEGLLWLSGGMGFFAVIGLLAVWNDKASRIPWTPREFPFPEDFGTYKMPVKEY